MPYLVESIPFYSFTEHIGASMIVSQPLCKIQRKGLPDRRMVKFFISGIEKIRRQDDR